MGRDSLRACTPRAPRATTSVGVTTTRRSPGGVCVGARPAPAPMCWTRGRCVGRRSAGSTALALSPAGRVHPRARLGPPADADGAAGPAGAANSAATARPSTRTRAIAVTGIRSSSWRRRMRSASASAAHPVVILRFDHDGRRSQTSDSEDCGQTEAFQAVVSPSSQAGGSSAASHSWRSSCDATRSRSSTAMLVAEWRSE